MELATRANSPRQLSDEMERLGSGLGEIANAVETLRRSVPVEVLTEANLQSGQTRSAARHRAEVTLNTMSRLIDSVNKAAQDADRVFRHLSATTAQVKTWPEVR